MTGDPPSFALTYVERTRDELTQQVFTPHLGVPLDAERMQCLVDTVSHELGARTDTVLESLRHLAGRTLQPLDAIETSWRLAGNLRALRDGLPVRPWSQQRADEWVPLQILGCIPARDRRGRVGHYFRFRVLAGTPCPMMIQTFWNRGACQLIAQEIGFSKPWHQFPFHRPSELMRLRLIAGIEVARSTTAPSFFEVRGSPSIIKWNRDNILRLRCRAGMACPEDFKHPCSACALGYRECPAAVHQETYQLRFCNGCGQEAYFDPERHALHCVECDNRERLRPQGGT